MKLWKVKAPYDYHGQAELVTMARNREDAENQLRNYVAEKLGHTPYADCDENCFHHEPASSVQWVTLAEIEAVYENYGCE